jgi:hypothetical protein
MLALGTLYKEMHAAVKQEVATAKAIFPNPDMVGGPLNGEAGSGGALGEGSGGTADRTAPLAPLAPIPTPTPSPSPHSHPPPQALDMFMQRLFEQDVQLALEKLLGRPGSWGAGGAPDGAGAPAQQARLRLLADAYAKTVRLAANCERALRGVQVGALGRGVGGRAGRSRAAAALLVALAAPPPLPLRSPPRNPPPRRSRVPSSPPPSPASPPPSPPPLPPGRRHHHLRGPVAHLPGGLPRAGAGLAGRRLPARGGASLGGDGGLGMGGKGPGAQLVGRGERALRRRACYCPRA